MGHWDISQLIIINLKGILNSFVNIISSSILYSYYIFYILGFYLALSSHRAVSNSYRHRFR
jgi:hypothetical protein